MEQQVHLQDGRAWRAVVVSLFLPPRPAWRPAFLPGNQGVCSTEATSFLLPVAIAALNDTLREEVQRLKLVTGQAGTANGAQMMNYGPSSSSFGAGGPPQPQYPNSHAMQSMLAAHQLQQLQIHPQHHQLQPRPNLHHPQQQQQQQQVRGPAQNQPPKEREGGSDGNSTAPK